MLGGDQTCRCEAGHGVIPVIVFHVQHMAPVHTASHVHRDVQTAVALHGGVHRALDVSVYTGIGLHRKGFQTTLTQEIDGVVGGSFANVRHTDLGALTS